MPKSRNPKIEFDRLKMYFREPYVIDFEDTAGSITIYQPSIGDLIKYGEKDFYQTLTVYTTNTTQNRLMLWDSGVDWNEISDYELFSLMLKTTNPEINKCLFGDIDMHKFETVVKTVNDKQSITLYNKDADIEINEIAYFHISQYLRLLFNNYPEEKITPDPILKKWYIDADRRKIKNEEEKMKKGKQSSFSLQPLVSSYINHPGTKYKLSELKDVGIFEFFDSIQRLQIYESATAVMKGMYSGFVSSKDIPAESYNFMKEIKQTD